MFQDILSFSKELQKGIPPLCLIIAKEGKEAVDLVIKGWQGRIRTFEGEDFSVTSFYSEVENLFLFEEPLLCHIQDIDKLKDTDRKILIAYLKRPNNNVSLLLSSSTATLVKEVKQYEGIILQMTEEKPWLKRQRMERFLADESKAYGFSFPMDAIKALIDYVGSDREILSQEFEKLVTYTFSKKSISIADVKELSHKSSSFTLWDLGEAIFAKDFALSFERGKAMIDEGISLFTIIAQLRTQFRTLASMTILYEEGGTSRLTQEFSYLKGSVLAKKVEEIKGNSLKSLKKGLFFLFESELQAKSINLDPCFALELLLIKLMTSKSSFSNSVNI